jgi:methylenetetrahydrofolate reductase (NADPH)
VDRIRSAGDDVAGARRIGVEATVGLAEAALAAGAPGLHLYTFNEHESALDVLSRLNLPRPSRPSLAAHHRAR